MPNILKKSLIYAPAVKKAPLTCDNTSGLYSVSIWSRSWSCGKIPSGKGGRLLAFFFKLIVAHNPHSLISVCFLKIKQKDPLTSINIFHWKRRSGGGGGEIEVHLKWWLMKSLKVAPIIAPNSLQESVVLGQIDIHV